MICRALAAALLDFYETADAAACESLVKAVGVGIAAIGDEVAREESARKTEAGAWANVETRLAALEKKAGAK